MNLTSSRTALRLSLVAVALTASSLTAVVLAQDTNKTKPAQKDTHNDTKKDSHKDAQKPATATPPEAPLTPGMTAEDMKAMMEAATPGPMQAWLCEDEGTWEGQCKMWMGPGTEPTMSKSQYTVTPILSGRFVRQEAKGDMGEWGPFEGTGMTGFDNAKGEFQSTWADCMGTGMMYGTGTLSSDKKVLTINYTYFCPMAKKTLPFKETFTRNDDGTRTMRMWGSPPGGGEIYKVMETVYARANHTHDHAKHADAETKASDSKRGAH